MNKFYLLPLSIFLSAAMISGAWVYSSWYQSSLLLDPVAERVSLEKEILPENGITLPVSWGNLAVSMAKEGVIDEAAFTDLYSGRGGLPDDMKTIFTAESSAPITINKDNSGIILNLLWAFGLGNKNPILDTGEMNDPEYGGAGNFASTGGWSLSKGDAMTHYSKHEFLTLTADQQSLVENVSKNIYRPCCGNSTHFPDCNHGMAMLGLLEILASSNVDEEEMYKIALQVNAYWFPEQYLTIGKMLQKKGLSWKDSDPKNLLGFDFSSRSGYQNVLSEVEPVQRQGGGGCGI